jgi:hypothetical protein
VIGQLLTTLGFASARPQAMWCSAFGVPLFVVCMTAKAVAIRLVSAA